MSDSEDVSKFDSARSFTYLQKIVQKAGPAASASYTLLASVLILTLLGWYIDRSIDTSPIGLLIGLGFGLLTGFYHLARVIWPGGK